jgi:hypothetical protein
LGEDDNGLSGDIGAHFDQSVDLSVPPTRTSPDNGATVSLVIGGIVLLIFFVGQCSSQDSGSSFTPANMVDTNMSTAIAAQAPPVPTPLNAESLERGAADLRIAHGAEGFSGAMIYSQNCYDALGRDFSWQRLDICGAFDVLAARAIDGVDTSALATEEIYFQSEAVAGRYLAAATGAGEEPGNADQRLSDLQSRMATQRIPRTAAMPSNLDNILEEAIEESAPISEPIYDEGAARS